jgi:hypothetical protein
VRSAFVRLSYSAKAALMFSINRPAALSSIGSVTDRSVTLCRDRSARTC